jgi:MFS family permease
VLCGIGYAIYASVIWGSIPYTVEPRTVGTAYGICTAIQNIGLASAPVAVSALIDTVKVPQPVADDDGNIKMEEVGVNYAAADYFFLAVNVIGLVANIALYFVDLKYYGGVLNNVDEGESLEALITSPAPGTKGDILRGSMGKSREAARLAEYRTDDDVRASLKRSLAAQRPYQ